MSRQLRNESREVVTEKFTGHGSGSPVAPARSAMNTRCGVCVRWILGPFVVLMMFQFVLSAGCGNEAGSKTTVEVAQKRASKILRRFLTAEMLAGRVQASLLLSAMSDKIVFDDRLDYSYGEGRTLRLSSRDWEAHVSLDYDAVMYYMARTGEPQPNGVPAGGHGQPTEPRPAGSTSPVKVSAAEAKRAAWGLVVRELGKEGVGQLVSAEPIPQSPQSSGAYKFRWRSRHDRERAIAWGDCDVSVKVNAETGLVYYYDRYSAPLEKRPEISPFEARRIAERFLNAAGTLPAIGRLIYFEAFPKGGERLQLWEVKYRNLLLGICAGDVKSLIIDARSGEVLPHALVYDSVDWGPPALEEAHWIHNVKANLKKSRPVSSWTETPVCISPATSAGPATPAKSKSSPPPGRLRIETCRKAVKGFPFMVTVTAVGPLQVPYLYLGHRSDVTVSFKSLSGGRLYAIRSAYDWTFSVDRLGGHDSADSDFRVHLEAGETRRMLLDLNVLSSRREPRLKLENIPAGRYEIRISFKNRSGDTLVRSNAVAVKLMEPSETEHRYFTRVVERLRRVGVRYLTHHSWYAYLGKDVMLPEDGYGELSPAARSQLRLIRLLLKARVGEISTREVQAMLVPGYMRPEKQCFLLQMMQKAGKLDDRKLSEFLHGHPGLCWRFEGGNWDQWFH